MTTLVFVNGDKLEETLDTLVSAGVEKFPISAYLQGTDVHRTYVIEFEQEDARMTDILEQLDIAGTVEGVVRK